MGEIDPGAETAPLPSAGESTPAGESTTVLWPRIKAAFQEIAELEPDEQNRKLAALRSEQPGIWREVAGLLDADRGPTGLLPDPTELHASPLVHDLPTAEAFADDAGAPFSTGDVLGAYRLVEVLGEGGMGAVFLGERIDGQFDQRVAIKVVRGQVDGSAVYHRFFEERRILASLSHPNIARLYDGGFEKGRPYLVMEHVDGSPIDVYCDRRRLSIESRLELFRTVCEAVEHAHQNLVVHRDLKPSNILVTPDGRVKLLDFGIAKLLQSRPDSEKLTRHPGAAPLTPAYAAPEQFLGFPVTTATDVFALGVLLFELLCGSRPFPEEASPSPSPFEVVRRVLDEETPKPSEALIAQSKEPGSLEGVLSRRSITQRRLQKMLRGDLDLIVDKSLSKNPDARYASAAELRADLERFGAMRPIRARAPTSTAYRLGLYTRRNGIALAFGLVVFSAICVTFAGTWLSLQRAEKARIRSEQAVDFLINTFDIGDRDKNIGSRISARDLLEAGAQRVETDLAGQPDAQALMSRAIGGAYVNLGELRLGREWLERAAEQAQQQFGPDSLETARAELDLGLAINGEAHPKEAEPHILNAERIYRSKGGSVEFLAEAANALAMVAKERGDFEEAVRQTQRALEIDARREGHPDFQTASYLANQGMYYNLLGRPEEGLVELHRASDLLELPDGSSHRFRTSVWIAMSASCRLLDRPEEAERWAWKAEALARETFEENHARVAEVWNHIGMLAYDAQNWDQAIQAFRRTFKIADHLLEIDHPWLLKTYVNLGVSLNAADREEEACEVFEEAWQRSRGIDKLFFTTSYQIWVGSCRRRAGKLDEAEELLRQAYEQRVELFGEDHQATIGARKALDKALAERDGTTDL